MGRGEEKTEAFKTKNPPMKNIVIKNLPRPAESGGNEPLNGWGGMFFPCRDKFLSFRLLLIFLIFFLPKLKKFNTPNQVEEKALHREGYLRYKE